MRIIKVNYFANNELFFLRHSSTNIFRVLFFAAASLSLASCASNKIILETSDEVTKTTTIAVERSKELLTSSRKAWIEANAALIASDPSCDAASTLYIYLAESTAASGAPLCASNRNAHRNNYRIQEIRLAYISDSHVAPMIAMMAALIDYTDAISSVLNQPTPDIEKSISSAISNATAASGFADTILATELASPVSDAASALATSQGESALKLLQFLVDLASEKAKVNKIEDHLRTNGDEFDEIVNQLKNELSSWSQIQNESAAHIQKTALERAYRKGKSSGEFNTFEKRNAFAKRVFEAHRDIESATARRIALDGALDEIHAIHSELRDQLDGNFSEEDRKRIGEINRARLIKFSGLLIATASKAGGF